MYGNDGTGGDPERVCEDYEIGSSVFYTDREAETDNYSYINAASCPDCGAGMIRLGGCLSCPVCGFGTCTV